VYELWIEEEPPEGDHWELAFQFAQQALTLDPSLSEPHAVLGDYYSIFGRYAEADGEFRKAAELDPRDPATLHLYAIHLYAMGYLRKALEYERRSVALDSTSPQPMMWLAVMTTTLGSPGDARRIWEKTDQLGAARPYCAAVSRTQLGEFEPFAEWERTRAVAEAQVPAEFRNSEVLVAGMRDAASRGPGLQLLRNVEARADPAFLIAQYSLFDDADGAYRVARTFKLVDDVWYFYQLCNIWSPRTASLRRDARFSELMEKWGFVQYWRRFGEPDLCSLSGKGVSCR
jgi:tetratricopeptide (TPR) repeat protein